MTWMKFLCKDMFIRNLSKNYSGIMLTMINIQDGLYKTTGLTAPLFLSFTISLQFIE